MRRLALVLVLCGCSDKRKPIARGDAGPSVVVVNGVAPDLGEGPTTPEVEPNDTIAHAEALGVFRVRGVLSIDGPKPDVDVFRIATPLDVATTAATTDAGERGRVATVSVSSGDGAVALDLLDAQGKILLTRTAVAHGTAQLSNVGTGNQQFLRVRRVLKKGEHAAAALAYTIAQTNREAALDEELEPNDVLAQANALPEGGAITGVIDPGDRDVFTLPAIPDGSTWKVELAGIPELAAELRLRRGDDVLVTAHAGKGDELRLRNLPGGAGLTLQVRAINGASDTPYTLHAASEPALDATIEHEPNDDRAHANHVVPGDVAGYLWPGDWDWFCADVPIGARIEGLPEVDWKLELFDATGKSLAKADAGKRGSAESIDPQPTARCVRVAGHGRDTAFEAPYRLSIVQ